jgi:ATP-binding cassette, subfamily B (MDR/TAP), member 1
MLFIFIIGGGQMGKAAKKMVEEYSRAATIAEEVLSSIRTAQAFGTEEKLAKLYDENLVGAQRMGYRKALANGFIFASIFGLIYLAYGLAFWEGSRLIADGQLNVGLVINCLFAVIIGSFSLSHVVPRIENFAAASAASQKIFQTIDRVPSIDSFSNDGDKPLNLKGNVELQNVNFIYPSRPEVQILNNFSLSIPAGKFTAIVGASGSGKSTIIQLLERFYDPIDGQITLDGYNLKDLNVRHLRSCMSLVQQEPVLFATSIYENVCHGMIGTLLDTASPEEKYSAVQKACIMANADQFIQNLPDGYETIVGERGFLLSGGQKQRIAIARAIVSNPKILLLDEATSALDTSSERVVQKALDEASKDRTTICIAHRLSTIKNADNIVVMSRGQIVETGTHEQLLNFGGIYKSLVEAQEISAARKEGIEKAIAEGDQNQEIVDRLVLEQTLDEESVPLGLAKTKSAKSIVSIEAEKTGFASAGIVAQKKYSSYQLIKKVFLIIIKLMIGIILE